MPSDGKKRPLLKIRSTHPARGIALSLALMIGLVLFATVWKAGAHDASKAEPEPFHIVVVGDSLSAGFGLQPDEAFPQQLDAVLASRDLASPVTVTNAGVSGDTSSGGLARIDWSVPDGTDAVILQLGANDALRGIDPVQTHANLDAMITRLKQRNIKVLLAGMKAPPNMGEVYGQAFNAIYPTLAQKHNVAFYPFFLEGVAADPSLNLDDGMHPNPEGIARIVAGVVPLVEALVGSKKR